MVTDNVRRRQEFEAAHPGVSISHHEDPWHWEASWTDSHDQDRTITESDLGPLLDRLEAELDG